MSAETDNTFERCKQQNINCFDFSRVITGIRATKFGWGRFNDDKSADWFLQRCIEFAVNVMDSAYNNALEHNEEWSCECGGFRALASPTGHVLLQFVLASWGEDWEEELEENQPVQGVTEIYGGPLRRRILKLHKEQ